MSTRVRLTDAEEWPQHGDEDVDTKNWHLCRGMEVTVGKPVEPDYGWTCDTDLVWPVIEWDYDLAKPQKRGTRPFVCRHQIQAGD